jgi:Lar family restriction alleviation protein
MNLKPCPFCGKTEIIVLNANEISELDRDSELWADDPAFAAVCDFNKGGCGATGGYRETVTEASETWNRRT